jgi:hypothetical protein
MPVGIAPTPSDAPTGQQKKGAEANVAVIPFARASKWHIEQSNVQTVTGSGSSQVFNFPVASYGYLSAVLVTVVSSGGNLTAATGFEDAPWSVLQNVLLQDVNGVPIWQLSGYHSYLAAKYGGYRLFPPDGIAAGTAGGNLNENNSFAFTNVVTSGAAGVAGQFKFILPIFLEFGLDGLGCLPNMDASARYNLQLTVAGYTSVNATTGPLYTAITGTTPPTTLTITIEILARSQPPAQDMFGNMNSVSPPAVGTVQYWTTQTASGMANGANTIQLTRVGNLIRHHILVFRNTNGTRTTAESGGDVPSLFEFDWDVGQRYVANTATLRYIMAYAVFGFDVPNGVLALPDTTDPDKIAISEYGDEWLGTVGATKFTLRFTTTTGSGSLTILTNDIVPASGQVYAAPSLMV